MARHPDAISASEIGQFTYCPRAWWLARVEGRLPTNVDALLEGERRHRLHGRGVRLARLGLIIAYVLLAAGGLTILALVVSLLLGVHW